MTAFEITRDLILLGVGLFGAGLSIFNYFQTKDRDRRKMRITMGTAMPTYPDGTIGRPHAQIEATNIGQRPITVSNIYIEVPNNGRMFPIDGNGFPGVPDTMLPATLSDGDTAHRCYAYIDIAQALQSSGRDATVTLTPVAEDSAGGVHKGEPWTTSPSELIKVGRPIKSS